MKSIEQFFKRGKGIRLLLFILDAVVVTASWFGSYFLRMELTPLFGYPINEITPYLHIFPAVFVIYILSGVSFGFYRRPRDISPLEDAQAVIKASLLSLLTVSATSFLFKELNIARSVVGIQFFLNIIGYSLVRWFVRAIEDILHAKGLLEVRCVIVGTSSTGIRALQKISDHPEIGHRVLGFITMKEDEKGKKISGIPVLGTIEELEDAVRKNEVDEVIFASPELTQDEILNYIAKLSRYDLSFRVISDVFEVLSKELKVDVLEEFPVFSLGTGKVTWIYHFTKRLFDLTCATVLLFLTLPLWLIISALIKLDSPGPVFFIQERVGYRGRRFKMYKFRTMRCDVNPYEEAPRRMDDPRITRFGRFLRRTSLDELPQLINVIKGDMSLVGPRPEMPFIVEKYNEWQKLRLLAKPGITGLWQILGRKDIPLHENLEYDFYYIKNRSFLFDLVILLKTIPAVLRRRGAY